MTNFYVFGAGTFVVGAYVGLLVGLRIKHRRFLAERRRCGELEAKVDAYDRQAFATDLDQVGPAQRKPTLHEDGQVLYEPAEQRTYSLDEVIDELGFTQAEIDAADDEPPLPSARCDFNGPWKDTLLCVPVDSFDVPVLNEGWPVQLNDHEGNQCRGHVVRFHAGAGGSIAEVDLDHSTWEDGPTQPWVHTPCGTPITVDDDGTESCSTCGTVITETTEPMAGLNNWADAIHVEDDGPESLPRVLPEGRISD